MLLRGDNFSFFNFQVNQLDKVLFTSLSKPIFVFGCNYSYKYKYKRWLWIELAVLHLFLWSISLCSVPDTGTSLGRALQSAQSSAVYMACLAWESYWCAARTFAQGISILFWFFFFLILSMCVLIISYVGFGVKRLFPAPFSIWCCWNNCSGFFIKDRIMMPSWFRRGCRVNIIRQSDYNWVKSMLNENNKRFIELKRQEDLQH